MQYKFVRKKQTVHPAVPNSYTLVDASILSMQTIKTRALQIFGIWSQLLLHNSSRCGHLA